MLFVSSHYIKDSNPSIADEITELIELVSQMDKSALDAQAMQHASLEPSEVQSDSLTHQKAITKDNAVSERELLAAFEMLDTQDRTTNDMGDLRSKCERSKDNVETRSCSMETVKPETSQSVMEASNTIHNNMEHLWSRIVLLADRIGINRKKILEVKNI